MAAIDLTSTVPGAVLREMRDAAGLSLIVMADRGGCPRQHLARVDHRTCLPVSNIFIR